MTGNVTDESARPHLTRAPLERQDLTIVLGALAVAAVFALAAQALQMPRLQSFVGLIVILAIGYIASTNRRAIDVRTVAWGLGLQVIFALVVLKTSIGQ